MAIYYPPSMRHYQPGYRVFSTWMDHMPFGYDLMAALRPDTLVELGVYNGLSYFGFCQAVHEHRLDTRCYAIDSWEGDRHTDSYPEEIWQNVENHNSRYYSGFSSLLRMRFEEALPRFANNSLDLIHLDGLHTYSAVTHDFESWYPKLRPGGVFLFHDIRARLQDFGVWRFWDEIEREHETFAFDQGFGLGVLRKPGGERTEDGPLLKLLFEGTPETHAALRALYVHMARHCELQRRAERQNLDARHSRASDPGSSLPQARYGTHEASNDPPSIYLPPSARRFKPGRIPKEGWTPHPALAYDLVAAMRPRLVVALGVTWGESYYGYCQSVQEHDTDTLCYAVGAWSEDKAREEFRSYGHTHYSGFSYLMPMSATQALQHFSNATIDILQVGEHGCEATAGEVLRHWYPKIRPGGVLCVHDIGPEESGARHYWEGFIGNTPSFVFPGKPALGLLRKPDPTGQNTGDTLLDTLFRGNHSDQEKLCEFYQRITEHLRLDYHLNRQT